MRRSLYKLFCIFIFLLSGSYVPDSTAHTSVKIPNNFVYKNTRSDVCVVSYETIEQRKIACMAGIAERIIDALPTIWSTIQNVAIQAGSVVVVAGTALFTRTSEKNNDYTIPQLPGEFGDRYELYGRHFIYIKPGWKLASRVTVEDILEMEDEVSVEIAEPEYVIVEREGWTNSETYWLSSGMRLYKQCCMLGGDDGKTVLYYDLAYDATLTKDFEQKRSEQKRKLEKVKALSSGSPNGRCWCNHPCFGVCNCNCACGCGKVKEKKVIPKGDGGYTKITNKQALEMAQELGFKKTNYYVHGQAVFQKGNKFITLDVDSHNGGVWKMASSVENLSSKKTRLGTYDKNLNRIGD